MTRKFSEVVTSMKNLIKAKQPTIDVSEGSVTTDVFINPPSNEFAIQYQRLDDVSKAQSILTARDSDVIRHANMYGLVRIGAVRSIVTLTFIATTDPGVTVPISTEASTTATSSRPSQAFKTTQESSAFVLNATTGKFEATALSECTIPGINGNVAQQSITTLVTNVTGVEGVINNNAAAGGQDRESIASLRSRVLSALRGNNKGTGDGYLLSVLSIDEVSAAFIVVSGDSRLTRTDAGAVDIHIRGIEGVQIVETITPTVDPYPDLVVRNQPAIITASGSLISASSGVLVEDTNWQWIKDSGSFGGSTLGRDKIRFLTTVDLTFGSLTLTYQHNALVPRVQRFINNEDNKMITADILVRGIEELTIDITAVIRVLAGFNAATIISDVTTAITTFLNTRALGEDLQQSDIVADIVIVAGVDSVLLPLSKFESNDGTVTQDANNTLIVAENKGVSAGTITVTAL